MAFETQKFVVIGGAKLRGIGLNFVRQLFKIGVENVAIFDICDPSDALAELKSEFANKTVLFHKVDVRKQSEIECAFKSVINAFGHVDILANFAGIANETKPTDIIEINLLGTMYATFTGIEHMSISKGGRGGTIINTASVFGLDSCSYLPSYSGSKHGVIGFTKSLADKDLESEQGIKFILNCLGFTETDILENAKSSLYGQNFTTHVAQAFDKYGTQTAEECVKSIADVIKKSENGSAWILSKGDHEKVNFHQYYTKN